MNGGNCGAVGMVYVSVIPLLGILAFQFFDFGGVKHFGAGIPCYLQICGGFSLALGPG